MTRYSHPLTGSNGSESLAPAFDPAELVALRLQTVSASAGRVITFDSKLHPEYLEREAAEQLAAEAARRAQLVANQIVQSAAETIPNPDTTAPSPAIPAATSQPGASADMLQQAYAKLAQVEADRAA